jgi:hypothetical protein
LVLKGAKMVGYADDTVTTPMKTVPTSTTDATSIPNPDYE